MELSHHITNNICLISITGDITKDESPSIQEDLLHLVEQKNYRGNIINLENVSSIDSSGIGVIVSIFRACQTKDTRLCLCQLNKKVTNVFELIELDKIIPMYPTEEKALASFKE
ncbi:MAG: STAS domain-containing protein [SAR324 cluster bacterium]|nr:STAS domain-containing protein [SAR324 cluster bacterium]